MAYGRKEIKTSYNGLVVNITIRKNGTIIYGQGIDAKSKIKIPGCSAKLHLPIPLNLLHIPDFERMVVHKIELKYEKQLIADNRKMLKNTDDIKKGIFTLAFEACTDISKFHKFTWGDVTFEKSLTYFVNKVLPILDRYGLEIDEEDVRMLQNELIQCALHSKQSNDSIVDAENSTSAQLQRSNYIYQVLRRECSEYFLPELDLEIGKTQKKVHNELPKALPDSVRIKLSRILFRSASTPVGGLAMAGGMMLYCGVRTAESAAIFYGDVSSYGSYGTYNVIKQERDCTITDILKTQNAYRCIILPQIMLDLLAERKAYLLSLVYSPDFLESAPITFSGGDASILTRSQNISAYVKNLLKLCGCSEDLFYSFHNVMFNEPDIVDGERLSDITAYILRRDWATRSCNVCGLRMDQADYLLGHANNKKAMNDYLTNDSQASMAWCLEHYVFDPAHTHNPAFSPITITSSNDISLSANQAFELISENFEEGLTIELTVECLEAFDVIKMVASADDVISIIPFSRTDDPELREKRTLIGELKAESYYKHWLNKADEINIKELE